MKTTVDTLEMFPHGKVNLGLIIKGKREDGYHLLETLMVPIDLNDRLVLEKRPAGCSLEVVGIEIDAISEDNLCWRAWKVLKDARPEMGGVHIHLEKGIPAGAGLGGGSSDAAFTLKGLNQLYDLGLTNAELADYAARLGADCPFFIYGEPMLATGTGTTLEAFPLELPYDIRVVTSEIHSSTPAAYNGLDWSELNTATDLRELLRLPVSDWKSHLRNDLEGPVFKIYPELAETKARLYAEGAIYAAMSGSGSAVFGLFPQ